jgi:hypothetical protein
MVTDLETLKEHYKLEFDIKQTLENKANNMTTISGSVTALLFGFGQLFISILIDKHYQWLSFINSFLLVGSLAGLIAIVLSVLGFRIQDYSYVIGKVVISRPSLANLPNNFQAGANNDPASVTNYQNCIKENEKKNNSKSKYIEAAQWAFSVSIGMIAFIVGWLVVAPIHF